MKICYHGTTKENAKTIIKEGFVKHTFFAKHQEDALEFGGDYIFAVAFDSKKIPDNWQFISRSKISPKKIIEHYRLKKTLVFENTALRERVFKYNIKELTPKGE